MYMTSNHIYEGLGLRTEEAKDDGQKAVAAILDCANNVKQKITGTRECRMYNTQEMKHIACENTLEMKDKTSDVTKSAKAVTQHIRRERKGYQGPPSGFFPKRLLRRKDVSSGEGLEVCAFDNRGVGRSPIATKRPE